MSDAGGWKEIFEGGSADAEAAIFELLAQEIVEVLAHRSADFSSTNRRRALFAKTVAEIDKAQLVLDNALPADLVVGHFRPGAVLPLTIRFSNASDVPQSDTAPDLRGVGLRLGLAGGASHDLVCANYPASFCRNARQLHAFVLASADGRELLLARLAARVGALEAKRIAATLKTSLKLCSSLAVEHFWSAGALLWGSAPVRLGLHPMTEGHLPSFAPGGGRDMLRIELAARLAADDVQYRLAIQRYVDETRTPIEDASVIWRENVSRSVAFATVVIPRSDYLGQEEERVRSNVDPLRFNPWNAPPEFRPLGGHNRLLRDVYALSRELKL